MKFSVQALAEQLQGSGKSITEALEAFDDGPKDENDLTEAQCAELDQLVFCCTCCDNWFEIGEMSEKKDWVCESCEDDI